MRIRTSFLWANSFLKSICARAVLIRRRNFALYLIVLSFFSFSADLPLTWEFAGWHGGGNYPNVEFNYKVNGRVYLTSDVSGIWRSDNLGENWYSVNDGLKDLNVTAVKVASRDSNILYAAAKTGLYVSRDAGLTWTAAHNPNHQLTFVRPDSYQPIAISMQNAQHVCVATSTGRVLCSDDAGDSWTLLKQFYNEGLTNISFNPSSKKLFVGGSAGFRYYDFTTKKWSGLYADLHDLTDLWILRSNYYRLYAAANGELWTSVNEGRWWQKARGAHEGKIFRLALESHFTPKIYAAVNKGWSGKVIVSVDNGATWKEKTVSLNPDIAADPTNIWADKNSKINALTINPWIPKWVFRTNGWGVFFSKDSGVNWDEKIQGAPNTVGSDLQFIDEELFVATMDNGLLKSPDYGAHYETVFPFDHYEPLTAGHVWRVISPQENVIIATSSPWNENINQVIVSLDGGKEFTQVTAGLPDTRPVVNTMWGQGYPRALAVDPVNPKRIYLGIDGDDGGGLFVSNNGGLNWKRSEGQPGSLRVYNGLAVDPTHTQRIFWGACGEGGGVWLSLDQGATWQLSLDAMKWVFDLMITPNGTIYAAGDEGGPVVYISRDHGVTWDKSPALAVKGAAEALAFDPTNQDRIAVSTVLWNEGAPGKIFLSSDGGTSWEDITGDLPAGAGAAAMTFSPDGRYLFISRYAGSVYRLKLREGLLF